MNDLFSLEAIALVIFTFAIAGTVKGAIGMGVPIIALVFLSVPLGIKSAIAIMLVPAIVTNIWQAIAGPSLWELLRRLWSFLLLSSVGVWLGVSFLSRFPQDVMLSILGGVLALYSAISLISPQIRSPGVFEPFASPIVGVVAGLVHGATGVFMVPGVVYLQALGLGRDQLVQSLGLSFVVINVSMAGALLDRGFIDMETSTLAVLALLPTWMGLYFGQKIRKSISEILFRKVFFSALLAIGLYFIALGQT